MIIETAIATDRAVTATVGIGITDPVLRRRVREAARLAGFGIVADGGAAPILIADAMQAASAAVVVIGTEALRASAFENGAAGGLASDFTPLKFERTVLAVAAGLRCFDLPPSSAAQSVSPVVDHALADETETLGAPLTTRETEVLAQMTTGASNKQIARALDISVHTAKFHVASIIAKLGANGRTDAVARTLTANREMI